MPECARCGRSAEDGATLEAVLGSDGPLCVVCVSWRNEIRTGRDLDQASLGDYTEEVA